MSRTLALAGVAAAALALASSAEAAAPRYILVSGPGMPRPVLLDDWNENLDLLVSLVQARRADAAAVRSMALRPRLRLSLFWGVPESPRPSRPGDANQTGWLYPATPSEPAVIDLLVSGTRTPRIVPVDALRILSGHGVPTGTSSGREPVPCASTEVRTLVRRVVAAFNSGNLAAVDELFARKRYRWYSTTTPGSPDPVVIERRSLPAYVAGRHALGERLRLRSVRITGNSHASPPYGNFVFSLVRSADDLEPTRYDGKGAAYCFRARPDVVFVWSMAARR